MQKQIDKWDSNEHGPNNYKSDWNHEHGSQAWQRYKISPAKKKLPWAMKQGWLKATRNRTTKESISH